MGVVDWIVCLEGDDVFLVFFCELCLGVVWVEVVFLEFDLVWVVECCDLVVEIYVFYFVDCFDFWVCFIGCVIDFVCFVLFVGLVGFGEV